MGFLMAKSTIIYYWHSNWMSEKQVIKIVLQTGLQILTSKI